MKRMRTSTSPVKFARSSAGLVARGRGEHAAAGLRRRGGREARHELAGERRGGLPDALGILILPRGSVRVQPVLKCVFCRL